MRKSAVFLAAFLFVLLTGPFESLIARHVSPDLQYRITILICLSVGLGLTLYTFLKRRGRLGKGLRAGWPILLFCGLAMLSTIWSISSTATLPASIALSFFSLAAICLTILVRWDELLLGLLFGAVFLGILSLILIPVGGLMNELHEGALRGPFTEKNRAGMVYAIGAVTAMALAFYIRRSVWLVFVPFFLGLLYLSQSGTSIIAAIIAIGALCFGELLRNHPKRLIIGSWFGLIALAGVSVIILTYSETLLDLVGEDATFTGRDQIWPAVIRRIEVNPILGYGYDAFWRDGNTGMSWLWYEAGFEVFNAHNGWLETMLSVGVFGALIMLIMTFRMGIGGLAGLNQPNDARRVAVPFTMLIIMMSLTESAIGGPEGPAWLLFIIISTKVALGEEKQVRRASRSGRRRSTLAARRQTAATQSQ